MDSVIKRFEFLKVLPGVNIYEILTKCEVNIYGIFTKCEVKIYGLLTRCEVKMTGYWPSSFFACLYCRPKRSGGP